MPKRGNGEGLPPAERDTFHSSQEKLRAVKKYVADVPRLVEGIIEEYPDPKRLEDISARLQDVLADIPSLVAVFTLGRDLMARSRASAQEVSERRETGKLVARYEKYILDLDELEVDIRDMQEYVKEKAKGRDILPPPEKVLAAEGYASTSAMATRMLAETMKNLVIARGEGQELGEADKSVLAQQFEVALAQCWRGIIVSLEAMKATADDPKGGLHMNAMRIRDRLTAMLPVIEDLEDLSIEHGLLSDKVHRPIPQAE